MFDERENLGIQKAPTSFGDVSFNMKSKLGEGRVEVRVELPEKKTPAKTFLRVRLPDGWKIQQCKAGEEKIAVLADGTADLSKFRGAFQLEFLISK